MDTSDSDTTPPKKRFKCPVEGCNAAFSKNNKLTYHIRKHTGERPFTCNETGCNKSYTNSSHLRRHKKVSHEGDKDESVICGYEGCGLSLANRYSLKKHYSRKHNPAAYAFKCGECQQGFHKKKQLLQHSYLHTGEAPFRCDKCDLGFTTPTNLNKHRRSHKTYACDCGEVFERWSLMLKHRKRCQGSDYQCSVCDKTFSQSGNFKNHKLTHVDKAEKSVFVCPYTDCERFYFYKSNLKYHIDFFHKKIYENVSYKCTYPKCTLRLKSKPSLRMHLLRHFKWVPKKQRKTRRDKGIPKKTIIPTLCGVAKTNVLSSQQDEIPISNQVTDEDILKQCEVVLERIAKQTCAQLK